MKDLFSGNSGAYARSRPVYPDELYDLIYSHVPAFGNAWDSGTGNGQVAAKLASRFAKVLATDISEAQLSRAKQLPNITYLRADEKIPQIPDSTFDLVTVGTALHWFDFGRFYEEVKRTGKNGAVLAVWCYSLMSITPEIDPLLEEFAYGTLGDYWDEERRWVDEKYKTIPFPFRDLLQTELTLKASWDVGTMAGYLESWSSVPHYIERNGMSPVPAFIERIAPLWPGKIDVEWPLPVRLGLIEK